ncbi:unnamed protein product, partial [Prorocentrum cordatum]
MLFKRGGVRGGNGAPSQRHNGFLPLAEGVAIQRDAQREGFPPLAHSRDGFLPLTEDVAIHRVVQGAGRTGGTSACAAARHWRDVTERRAVETEQAAGASKEAARPIRDAGPEPPPQAVARPEALLQDAEATARFRAAQAMGEGGSKAALWQSTVSQLKAGLRARIIWGSRRFSAKVIGAGGPEAVLQAVGELKSRLQDEDANVRTSAAKAVGKGGPETALQAVGELKALLRDDGAGVREWAAEAIGKGGPEAVLQAGGELKDLLKDKDAAVRSQVEATFSSFGAMIEG